jgi:hypothetical protein
VGGDIFQRERERGDVRRGEGRKEGRANVWEREESGLTRPWP